MLSNVSLIHPYYKDRKRFDLQKKIWAEWSSRVCTSVDVTIVDDGSPEPLEISPEETEFFRSKGLRFSVFRIMEDVKWNTPGALNLGVMGAPQPWILFQDSDCFFESDQWEKVLDLDPKINRVHKFNRQRYGDARLENIALTRYLNCTMLMHKHLFMQMGGFDEDFSGRYSGGYGFFDTDFDWRAEKKGFWSEKESNGRHSVHKHIIAGEWMPSFCGEPVNRDHSYHHRMNKRVLYSKKEGTSPQNRQILRFPWQCSYSNWL
jgi:hypothetical protein